MNNQIQMQIKKKIERIQNKNVQLVRNFIKIKAFIIQSEFAEWFKKGINTNYFPECEWKISEYAYKEEKDKLK